MRMLKLEDVYDVTVAKDGQEALDRVKESMQAGDPYNLIFMDVQMPNMDGLDSTRLIRQSGFSAPIVALTAYAEEVCICIIRNQGARANMVISPMSSNVWNPAWTSSCQSPSGDQRSNMFSRPIVLPSKRKTKAIERHPKTRRTQQPHHRRRHQAVKQKHLFP